MQSQGKRWQHRKTVLHSAIITSPTKDKSISSVVGRLKVCAHITAKLTSPDVTWTLTGQPRVDFHIPFQWCFSRRKEPLKQIWFLDRMLFHPISSLFILKGAPDTGSWVEAWGTCSCFLSYLILSTAPCGRNWYCPTWLGEKGNHTPRAKWGSKDLKLSLPDAKPSSYQTHYVPCQQTDMDFGSVSRAQGQSNLALLSASYSRTSPTKGCSTKLWPGLCTFGALPSPAILFPKPKGLSIRDITEISQAGALTWWRPQSQACHQGWKTLSYKVQHRACQQQNKHWQCFPFSTRDIKRKGNDRSNKIHLYIPLGCSFEVMHNQYKRNLIWRGSHGRIQCWENYCSWDWGPCSGGEEDKEKNEE